MRQVETEGGRVSGRPWEQWIAIDDKAYWFKPFLPNLVRCDLRIGFDDNVAWKLIARLGAALL